MIYRFFSLILSFVVKKFFRRITVLGEPIKGAPVIFTCNHPNMGVDPILVGATARRPLHFMAKSTLFSNYFLRLFFRSLNMVPAYRRSDNEDTKKNEESFKEAIDVLKNSGAFVIFPEGTSTEGRTLLPIKSGAARIALQSGLPVKIQPVTITYLEPKEFRSYVTVTYHDPISVSEKDDVKTLTSEIEKRLKEADVELGTTEDEVILSKVGKIFVRSNSFDDQAMLKRIAKSLKDEDKKKNLLPELEDFFKKCEEVGIPPELVQSGNKLEHSLIGLLGSLAAIFNYIPRKITALLVRSKSSLETAQSRLILGACIYLTWYVLCVIIFGLFLREALIIIPIGAYFLETSQVYFAYLKDLPKSSISKLAFEKETLQRKLLEAE